MVVVGVVVCSLCVTRSFSSSPAQAAEREPQSTQRAQRLMTIVVVKKPRDFTRLTQETNRDGKKSRGNLCNLVVPLSW